MIIIMALTMIVVMTKMINDNKNNYYNSVFSVFTLILDFIERREHEPGADAWMTFLLPHALS